MANIDDDDIFYEDEVEEFYDDDDDYDDSYYEDDYYEDDDDDRDDGNSDNDDDSSKDDDDSDSNKSDSDEDDFNYKDKDIDENGADTDKKDSPDKPTDKKETGEGGRYNGKDSTTKSSKPKTPGGESTDLGGNVSKLGDKLGGAGSSGTGGGNWFSKLTKGFKSGGGKAAGKTAEAGAKAGAKAAGKAGAGILKAIAPYIPYILLALLIIILIIVIIVAIVSIVSFLTAKSDPENMKTNPYVNSSYFYGIRTVYIDTEALVDALELSYKQYVVDVFEEIETDNPSVTISVTLPDEFDNSTDIDTHITNMASGIANIVATGTANYTNVDYNALYPQIEYFGLTAEQGDKTNDFITQYVNDNSLLTSSDSIDVNAIIDTAMEKENVKYIYNRCEKVMIKDEIATTEGLVGMEERQYIGSIYMPNSKVRVDSLTYTIASTSEEFHCYSKLIELNGGTETIQREKETKDNADIITGFSLGKSIIEAFTSIDTENVNAFSNGLSLFTAMSMAPEYVSYFSINPDTSVYTWKPADTSMLYYTYDASTKFIFTDFHLNVQLP